MLLRDFKELDCALDWFSPETDSKTKIGRQIVYVRRCPGKQEPLEWRRAFAEEKPVQDLLMSRLQLRAAGAPSCSGCLGDSVRMSLREALSKRGELGV